jgi:hypothetical protein
MSKDTIALIGYVLAVIAGVAAYKIIAQPVLDGMIKPRGTS